MGDSWQTGVGHGERPMKPHSTDVSLACHCPEHNGAVVRITARRYKAICRLPSPAHEQAIHRAVLRQETR